MKKMMKIIISLIIMISLINIFSINSIADTSLNDTISSANSFLDKGKEEESPINMDSLNNTSNYLYNTLLIIGIAVAFIWGIVLGIKFITGSVEQKVDVKKGIIAYLVGCIIVFGAFGIWKLAIEVLTPLS